MPRIARPATPESDHARREIFAYIKRAKITVNALANAVGVGQPMLFRFLSGETKNLTARSRKVLHYVHNNGISRITKDTQNKDNADLLVTLHEAFGHDHETTLLLADIVRAISPVLVARSRDLQKS